MAGNRTVLISGGGIAGAALAYWLARRGFRPTVVERARGLRSSGSPVDVRGPAVTLADRMGVLPELRAAATHATHVTFIDAEGRPVARIGMGGLRPGATRDVEVPRADLAGILWRRARDDAEFRFDDSIATLDQDPGGVDVTFEVAAPRRFDLVVGADGLHSLVRRLVLAPDDQVVRQTGLYIATLPLDGSGTADAGHDVLIHNTPGRAVAIHPVRGRGGAAFMFRGPRTPGFDPRDAERNRRMLHTAYAGGGWRIPELLDRVRAAPDLYFDAVSRVDLPRWSAGRVTLLGDAASCVSLFGDGSTLALTGAATLAGALAATPGDHAAAFRRYETTHRRRTRPKRHLMGPSARLLIPATRTGIQARNAAVRLLSAGHG